MIEVGVASRRKGGKEQGHLDSFCQWSEMASHVLHHPHFCILCALIFVLFGIYFCLVPFCPGVNNAICK